MDSDTFSKWERLGELTRKLSRLSPSNEKNKDSLLAKAATTGVSLAGMPLGSAYGVIPAYMFDYLLGSKSGMRMVNKINMARDPEVVNRLVTSLERSALAYKNE